MKRYYIAVSALSLFIVFIIAWSHYSRYIQFRDYHAIIAQHTTHTVAARIKDALEQKEHLVALFLQRHAKTIDLLIEQPDDHDKLDFLNSKINNYVRDHYAFTITDQRGIPIIEDIEGLVGEVCLSDLQDYIHSSRHLQRIHPSPLAYHYDIIKPFHTKGKNYIFFISFHAQKLAEILRESQAPSHNTMLVLPQDSGQLLLEVSSSGARDNTPRDSYFLNADERMHIVHQQPVDATRWQVIDSYAPELYTGFIHSLFTNSLLYLGSYSIIIAILFVYLIRAENKRRLAEQHKDEFLSIVSHELRTPLTAILGALGLLTGMKQNDYEKSNKLLNIAMTHSKRLAVLVNDILDMQKIEAGKMEFQLQTMEIAPLIHAAVNDISDHARQLQDEIQVQGYDQPIWVNGDYARLMQVMLNLLSNAIKYGKPEDTIVVNTSIINDHWVRVSVTDHGEGVAEAFQSRLFEKFTQADASSTRRGRGTGLGLNIVKRIVEKHAGRVGFVSRPGIGSTFYFELPLIPQG